MKNRRKYSREFKLEAVKLMNEKGPAEAAESLRVGMSLLYRWRRTFEEQGVEVTGKANFAPASAEEELRQLRHRVQELEEEKELRYFLVNKSLIYLENHNIQ